MDPYPLRDKDFPIDPYYSSVKFRIFTIKVIPVQGENATIFPSWAERKLVWLELIFDPFTLEVVIALHDGQSVETKQGQPREAGTSSRIIISPSYFMPVMDPESQLRVVLHRARDVQDKVLGFYKNPLPIPSQGTPNSKIADRLFAALVALKKEDEPSLELCFQNKEDTNEFYQAWLLAFGRQVNPHQESKCSRITSLIRGPLPTSIPLDHLGTPVSLQTPTNARNLVLPPLVYEKLLLSSESRASADMKVLENLQCHSYGNGTTESPYILEVFIPYDKSQGCKIPEYPRMHWRPKVSCVIDTHPFMKELRVEDHSTRMLREPLLPTDSRSKHFETLNKDKSVDEWIGENEKKKYWCLKLQAPAAFSNLEGRPKDISITFISNNFELYRAINSAISFAKAHSPFNPRQALVIQEIFLGHRLGRLLSDDILQGIKPIPSKTLSPRQTNIFNHVLSHDFTLVDGAPGTGKSKVTADIIAGFISQGKQVLVMTTNDATLDILTLGVLDALPSGDVRASEMVVRLASPLRYPIKEPKSGTAYKEKMLGSVRLNINRVSRLPNHRERGKIDKATGIFMTTEMVLSLGRFAGVLRRVFDLIVLDDANTVSESLALQLTRLSCANAFRWLVIGCSKGISPAVNIDEFEEMEICGSWFKRLLRHPEFRLNPLRLMKQYRSRGAIYEPINKAYFNGTIIMAPETPLEAGGYGVYMGFVNSARVCGARKGNPESYDDELLEMVNYRKEQSIIFNMAQKINKLTPHTSIVILCYCGSQRNFMATELSKVCNTGSGSSLSDIMVFTATVDDFASAEADYTIVHVPLWKDSYKDSADHGKFIIAMTRARRGVFAVGNLETLTKYEESRGAWVKNPWNHWLLGLENSKHGAIFEDMAEVDLKI